MTTEQTTRVIPAGWYQDPADDAKVRWWNGMTWTEHVESKPDGAGVGVAGALAIESGAGLTAEQRAAEARELERQYGLSTDGTEAMTRRASIDLDHRGPDTGTIPIQGVAIPRRPLQPAKTGTASAWLLAATPLMATLLAVVAGYVYFYVTPTPLVAAVAVVLYIIGFLWAVGDSRALQARGLKAPSPLWALALPVIGPLLYLVVRARAVGAATTLIAFVAVFALALGAPVALGMTGNAQTVTKALEIQQAVRADLVDSGSASSVSCPPVLDSTVTGAIFTCDAVLTDGSPAHVWVSIDNDAGEFSWALANR
ncbi:MAG TPA: DUF2510 domain-containing protein [Pseudolysinimonas sp.]|nr:DUF2510 domain-containing protein [Pseudolysinimonas sp.]